MADATGVARGAVVGHTWRSPKFMPFVQAATSSRWAIHMAIAAACVTPCAVCFVTLFDGVRKLLKRAHAHPKRYHAFLSPSLLMETVGEIVHGGSMALGAVLLRLVGGVVCEITGVGELLVSRAICSSVAGGAGNPAVARVLELLIAFTAHEDSIVRFDVRRIASAAAGRLRRVG